MPSIVRGVVRLTFSVALAVAVLMMTASRSSAQTPDDLGPLQGLIEGHCLDCHSGTDAEGGMDLDGFDAGLPSQAGVDWDSTRWERVLRRLQAGQMPPLGAEQPHPETAAAAIEQLVESLDEHARRVPRPGRTESIRRLTRAEYENAVRDLTGLKIDVSDRLPPDESSHGFDNITVGELSPVLLSRYITTAQYVSRVAMGGRQRGPGGVTFRLPADRTQESHVDGLPLGTRGGGLVEHTFAQDGEYEIQLRLTRDRDENVEGLRGTHPIDVLIDRARVHRFTVEAPRGSKNYDRDDTQIDANLKTRFHVSAGPHQIGVTFPDTSGSLQETKRQPFDAAYNRHRHPRQNPAIFEISIVGPYDAAGPGQTPSRERILGSVNAAEAPAAEWTELARGVLTPLVARAYRRPVDDSDLATPMAFFRERAAEEGFDAGIEAALAAVLVNPGFLLRIETEPEGVAKGEAYAISDVELATRIGFFLWSSLPDDQLRELAAAGRLQDERVLAAQVSRMLEDPRSQSLVDNFASQWLYLRNLDSVTPDLRRFPDFDDNLRQAFRRETELLFEDVMRRDRSVLELLRTDRTFLNERLAIHYGIPHVQGSHFRPVQVDRGTRRGGLLRHGSILTVTSYATRTSPTIRGNWILENLLGTPPPPPPPNVPSLQEKQHQQGLSVRERLALHREDPACASCHDRMDPLGFALDHFDAVGRWRDFEDGEAIDVSGVLPDGTTVHGADDLESAILRRPEMFVQAMTEKLLVFALGRGLESYDGPAVRRVVRDARETNYRFSSLIQGIVASQPFRMRVAN